MACEPGLPKFIYATYDYHGDRVQVRVFQCCPEMASFMKEMNGECFHVGSGEISGSIYVDQTQISFDDGWDTHATLPLKFCPFCGTERVKSR